MANGTPAHPCKDFYQPCLKCKPTLIYYQRMFTDANKIINKRRNVL